ncbi:MULTISPECIES: HAMP domain-containing sensor histidine kinase [Spirulina sp. CCY15215]|uniref:sensor histidine kinase n=1 Tax=Spirulina sp. CCY15215 TaxID=2767591 RepID=UPI00195090F7|nr:HAMP domain-containing sensor histidine kinase [Spirulina major]
MVGLDWSLPTLSQVVEKSEESWEKDEQNSQPDTLYSINTLLKAEGQWYSAIASLEQLLLKLIPSERETLTETYQGLLLSGSTPVLCKPEIFSHLKVGVFAPKRQPQFSLPAAFCQSQQTKMPTFPEYPLLVTDPLANERFCLALTPQFGLVLVLGKGVNGKIQFRFSFDPDVVKLAWQTLRSRLMILCSDRLASLDKIADRFVPSPTPDYRLVTAFSRRLLTNLPDNSPLISVQTTANISCDKKEDKEKIIESDLISEVELLQALTHEIRTPLTTIRMLTRLLLKKQENLAPKAIERLEIIDRECTDQIDRMELIFRAAELESKPIKSENVQLIPISLKQIIQHNIPRWKKQAQGRNITLDILLPEQLPTVFSNPEMLSRVLSGLMESFTRSLPTGGQLQVQVATAGHQLKVQLVSENVALTHSLKSMGQLLMFQPETGNLSLNLDVTKNLFQILGGKLTIRQRPQKGEVLTIFLPLGVHHSPFKKPDLQKQKTKL